MREKPEALALNMAEMLVKFGGLTPISSKHAKQIAAELCRLHARVQELEGQRKQLQADCETWKAEAAQAEKWRGLYKTAEMQLEAIGAGGVEALRTKGARDD